MSNLQSTELGLEGKRKVILLGTKNDRYESCISDLGERTRAHFLPEFIIWIIKVNHCFFNTLD